MDIENVDITQMYQKYKFSTLPFIQNVLKNIKVVKFKSDPEIGYYPLDTDFRFTLINNPRGKSLSLDAVWSEKRIDKNLVVYKTFHYLVKSTSRFFLKSDIGEILDQLDPIELQDEKLVAILYYSLSYCIPGTGGEHFIMKASLLCEQKEEKVKEKVEVKAVEKTENWYDSIEDIL